MRRVKRWIQRLFYVPKYEKMTDTSLTRLMTTSVLGLLLCAVCLGSLTWAWFSESITAASGTISAASFGVSLSVDGEPVEGASCTLSAGENHSVTLAAVGDAATGYCRLTLDGAEFHTGQIPRGETLTFTVDCSNTDSAVLTVTPNWGTYSGTADLEDGDVLYPDSAPPETAPTEPEPTGETEPPTEAAEPPTGETEPPEEPSASEEPSAEPEPAPTEEPTEP